MDPSTSIMSDEGTPIPVPRKPTIREGVLPGHYANQMQQFESQFETLVDFLHVGPSEYVVSETGSVGPEDITITNEVVARIILPRGVLQSFIHIYLRNNPAFAEHIINSLKSGDSQ